VTITQYAPERITATVKLEAPAVVVFSEMYYPGWQVYVDGARQDVLVADVAFRGVQAGAGAHTIELRYEPRSLVIGAWISAAALMLLMAITIATSVRARQRRVTPA
jgi:uncharacterized membrane protein YfhO